MVKNLQTHFRVVQGVPPPPSICHQWQHKKHLLFHALLCALGDHPRQGLLYPAGQELLLLLIDFDFIQKQNVAVKGMLKDSFP